MMGNKKTPSNRVLYLAVAIAVSFAIWLFVDIYGNNGAAFTVSTEIVDVPIEFLGENDALESRGLMWLDDGTETELDVTLEGSRWLLAHVTPADLRVTVDLSNVDSSGTQHLTPTVTFTERRFTSSLRIREFSPSTVTVEIGDLYTKSIPIRCELSGNVAEGYTAQNITLSQSYITVRGQAPNIEPIAYARVLLNIGQDATQSVTQKLPLVYCTEDGTVLDPAGIHTETNEITATLPVYVAKELRLGVNLTEGVGARIANVEYSVRPSSIMVSGDSTVLNEVESITLGEFDLLDLGSGSTVYYYQIPVPEGCENLSGTQRATLSIRFLDHEQREVTVSEFAHTDLPEEKAVRILTEELPVTVFGTTREIAALTPTDITVTANLSNFAAASGLYTVPAIITVNNRAGDIGILGTYQLQVDIHDAGSEPEVPEEPSGNEIGETTETGEPAENGESVQAGEVAETAPAPADTDTEENEELT